MFVTRLVSQSGIGPNSLELHIPSAMITFGCFQRQDSMASRKLESEIDFGEGGGGKGGEGGGGGGEGDE